KRRYDAVPGSIATPLLAIRATRRALLENPNDALNWFLLERAYATLNQSTREREWAARLPLLESVRHVQRVNALNHVVLLDPDNEAAHDALAMIYERKSAPDKGGFYDLALK